MNNPIIEELRRNYERAQRSYLGEVWTSEKLLSDLLELFEEMTPEAPAGFSDPRAPLEAEDVRRVLEIIRNNDDLFIRFEYLRQRLQAGEDVAAELVTIGYLIGKRRKAK